MTIIMLITKTSTTLLLLLLLIVMMTIIIMMVILMGSLQDFNKRHFIVYYSNLGYALLSRVLAEKFANSDYEGWVQRNILMPLGMRNTGFNLDRYLTICSCYRETRTLVHGNITGKG